MDYSKILTIEDFGEPYDLLDDILDVNEMVKLSEKFGGINIWFKKDISEDFIYNTLCFMFGKEKSIKIMKRFNNSKIYFSKIRTTAKEKIRTTIVNDYNGYNRIEIAIKYGYSEKQIDRIIADYRKSADKKKEQSRRP
ncbi:MAG: hypothetical protein LBU77_04400 [Clostridiales bacterium]|jgi:Mor family transcriptional regulator|nr:hypothetical protein [Clostridiales bacterium]